jgi:hypothetical protein
MTQGIGVAGIYVDDQDAALDFYVGKLGFGSTPTSAMVTIAG